MLGAEWPPSPVLVAASKFFPDNMDGRAGNELSQSIKFYNHREGSY